MWASVSMYTCPGFSPHPGRCSKATRIHRMFETAELGRRVSKTRYQTEAARLRWELLDAQRELDGRSHAALVVFGGVDAAGKSESVHLLNEWMDPRWIVTCAYGEPSDEERERPAFWRYWRDLPPRGQIGLFVSSWYSPALLDRVHRRTRPAEFEAALRRIADFERTLADDGALILKLWMHLSKPEQKRRLTALEQDPLTRWRVTRQQWKNWARYGRFVEAAETLIRATSVAGAPWLIVEGADERYRNLAVATAVRDALRRVRRQTRTSSIPAGEAPLRAAARPRAREPRPAGSGSDTVLATLDMTRTIGANAFARRLEKWQGRLNRLQRDAQRRKVSTILVFEGWDAAGKGGAIRRITSALDLRACRVIPIAAPTDEERAHHYLWRFWRHVGRDGRVTIYDRSWYGRVLVERVEGFATCAEWSRAYAEVNQFEAQLLEHGTVLVKYWLHITPEEQLRRFRERETSPYKSWKIGEDDWRNRAKWEAYEAAVHEMVARTSTAHAPWTLVAANDKRFARITVLRTACEALATALRR
jgi:AMP-polyphosphate phosphotransferase